MTNVVKQVEPRRAQSGLKRAPTPRKSRRPEHPEKKTPACNPVWQKLASRVQTKLTIGSPHDALERQADRVADQVMSPGPVELPSISRRPTTAQGCCDECQTGHIQRSPQRAQTAPPTVSSQTVSGVQRGGQPLPTSSRRFFESRLGHDFGHVRLHTDGQADQLSRQLDARAFTLGAHISFANGQFAPQTAAGKHLLAHELTHVIQQTRAGAPRRIQRKPPDQTSGGGPAPEPVRPRPGSVVVEHYGILLANDPAWLRARMRRLIAREGLRGADFWLAVVQGRRPTVSVPVPWAHARARGSLHRFPTQNNTGLDPQARQLAAAQILPMAIRILAEVRAEAVQFLQNFERQLRANAISVLNANAQRTEAEKIRYGISWTEFTPPSISVVPPRPITLYSMQNNTSSQDLQATARIAVQQRNAIEQKERERRGAMRLVYMGPHEREFQPTPRYHELGREIRDMRARYQQLLRILAQRHPVLAHFGRLDGSLSDLRDLATHGPGRVTERLLGSRIREQEENIDKVRGGIRDNDLNFWRLPKIVSLTKAQLGTSQRRFENRLIQDKVDAEQPGSLETIALLVMDVAALLAAPATGGLSLAVAAGVNAAVAVRNVQNYLMEDALANTSFDRAEAISQEEPSLFWVAVDIVAIIPELGDALRAFRGISRAVRTARTARLGTVAAREADEVLRGLARSHGLAEEAVERLVSSARDPHAALRQLGVTDQQLRGLRQAETNVAREAEAARVMATNPPAGGNLRVSPRGLLFSCTSPCMVLRGKYADQLASAPQGMLDELGRIEAAAAAARSDSARQRVADMAAAWEARIRRVRPSGWQSPMHSSAEFASMVRRRGSASAVLDRKPPGWTGGEEAFFRFGTAAHAEPGYRWVLNSDGTLRYDRIRQFDEAGQAVPRRTFDSEQNQFINLPERRAATELESADELARLASTGASATTSRAWMQSLRSIPGLEQMSNDALMRVMSRSPNLDHMKGQLLEELVGPEMVRRARRMSRSGDGPVEFIRGDRITDARGSQLTDGMLVRRQRDGSYEVLGIVESKAGDASARGLNRSHTSFNSLSGPERAELQREAIEELRQAHLAPGTTGAVGPEWTSAELLRTRGDEIEALMRDLHSADMGQIQKDFERLMPGENNAPVSILIDGQSTPVRASYSTTTAIGVTPSDVSIQGAINSLRGSGGGLGIRVQSQQAGVSQDALLELARRLRAEMSQNGSRF